MIKKQANTQILIMTKTIPVTHEAYPNTSVNAVVQVYKKTRLKEKSKHPDFEDAPQTRIEYWEVVSSVDFDVVDRQEFYNEDTMIAAIPGMINDVKAKAKLKIESMKKKTVSDRLAELGFTE